jgi:hypothetical protein
LLGFGGGGGNGFYYSHVGLDSPPPCEDHVWFEDRWMVASLCDE